MAFLRWLITVPLIVLAACFALMHREAVTIVWNPLQDGYEIPLYVVALGFLAVGFLAGAIATWFSMAPVRRDRRRQKKEIKALRKQLDAANENTLQRRDLTQVPIALLEKTK